MDQVDRGTAHGRHILKFRDHMDTIMVDESWMYLMRNNNKLLLVEDIDILIAPQVQHKSHIEKIMFLAVVGLLSFVPIESAPNEVSLYRPHRIHGNDPTSLG